MPHAQILHSKFIKATPETEQSRAFRHEGLVPKSPDRLHARADQVGRKLKIKFTKGV